MYIYEQIGRNEGRRYEKTHTTLRFQGFWESHKRCWLGTPQVPTKAALHLQNGFSFTQKKGPTVSFVKSGYFDSLELDSMWKFSKWIPIF